MTDLPFVDAHFHFWDFNHPSLHWDWLAPGKTHPILGDIEGLKVRRFGVGEYLAETRFHNVVKAVHVQAAFGIDDPVAETAWVQSLADATGWPHGILGHCDLELYDARDVLERHLCYSLFRGLRDIGSPERFEDQEWRHGYSRLGELELVYCHSVGPDSVGLARDLMASFPDVTFCVDQAGGPRYATSAYYEYWRKGMALLASQPNAVCKISGLGACLPTWTLESLRPWVLGCIETFGTERCFFGSNWPVDRLFSSYGDLIETYASIVSAFPPEERRSLLAGNAERVFRLGVARAAWPDAGNQRG
jgi:predicted TIM-barrel fold metal-dependent hydrolase